MQDVQAQILRLFYKGRRAHNIRDPFTCQSENVVYCISCRQCNCLYIGETGRRLRECLSEHLCSIRNQLCGFPVVEHFNSASHSLDDIIVCGLKQCLTATSAWNEINLQAGHASTEPIEHYMNFNVLWFWVYSALHSRALKQWFSNNFTVCFTCALSVRVYAYSVLYNMVISADWRRTKPETFNLSEQIWHFSEHFCLMYNYYSTSLLPKVLGTKNLVVKKSMFPFQEEE